MIAYDRSPSTMNSRAPTTKTYSSSFSVMVRSSMQKVPCVQFGANESRTMSRASSYVTAMVSSGLCLPLLSFDVGLDHSMIGHFLLVQSKIHCVASDDASCAGLVERLFDLGLCAGDELVAPWILDR